MLEVIITELLSYAFTGVNIIPTAMLIVIQCYWIIASIGVIDLDFLNFDVDVDVDLEGADAGGLLNAIALFMNIGEVPLALAVSLVALNFWIIAMLMYYLPIAAGGVVTGILLLPAFAASIVMTKYEIFPLKKKLFKERKVNALENKVVDNRCALKCDLVYGILGQAEITQGDSSIVINVKTQFEDETFVKDELAFVYRKDTEKDLYYIAKLVMDQEFYS